jgi:hypothetical protein
MEVRYLSPITFVGEVHSSTSRSQHGAELTLSELGIFIEMKTRGGKDQSVLVPFTNITAIKMETATEALERETEPKKVA